MSVLEKQKLISTGFIVAGLMNLSVLVFSRLFTNTAINQADPIVMSNFGLLMIVLWGVANMSIARSFYTVKYLVGVFAIEKFIYVAVWLHWILNNSVMALFSKDMMAGAFYAIYGINDFLFGVFFLIVFVRLLRQK